MNTMIFLGGLSSALVVSEKKWDAFFLNSGCSPGLSSALWLLGFELFRDEFSGFQDILEHGNCVFCNFLVSKVFFNVVSEVHGLVSPCCA
jgi:hypothetical protein